MAEEEKDSQEKTEEPTSKRLQDARERGQVPRSRELNTVVMLLAGSGGLLLLSSHFGDGLADLMTRGLVLDRADMFRSESVILAFKDAMIAMLHMLWPLLAIAMVAVFAPPIVIGGFAFSTKAMAPKLSKLNPIKGMKKLVSVNGLVELVKSLAKVILVAGAGYLLVRFHFRDMLALGSLDIEAAITHSFELIGWSFLTIACATIVIALADVPYQLFNHKKQLRMTKKEVKDESKNTEGDPQIKARVRRTQQEIAMSRMMAEVPGADVVVTNPTHFAVALKYDEGRMGAPKVVAKGADLVAAQIRSIAREHKVALFEAPPLARALYFSTELNQEIPAGLYVAVAQVLAYVFQLKAAIHGDGNTPARPDDLPVPEEFLRRADGRRPPFA